MSLVDVLTRVNAELPQNVVTTIGAPEPFGEGGAPRVAWVPVSEDFVPGGNGGDDTTSAMFPGTAKLGHRAVTIRCHVWGRSYALTEQLRDLVHNALHKLLWGSYSVGAGEWVAPDQSVKHGQSYVMTLTLFVPVLRPEEYKAKATTFVQECEMEFLNGNVEIV